MNNSLSNLSDSEIEGGVDGSHQQDIGPITMTTGRPTRSLIRCEDFGFGKSQADDFTRIYWKVR